MTQQAQRAGQPWGKTECWYVAHCQARRADCAGTEAGRHRSSILRAAIEENRAEEVAELDQRLSRRNDLRGRRHGAYAGPGSIIVETQQQSDTTYRLYDYGRPRELHLKEGLAAVKEKVGSGKVVRPAPSTDRQHEEYARAR